MRVSEVYASVQGEGPNVGRTTVFTRFGGCNLRCPGWPCDTQHAIDPIYRKEWKQHSPKQLVERVEETANIAGAKLITLTGGEPFLQKSDELFLFTNELRAEGYNIDCFSNGTLEYPGWVVEDIQFIVDWKLYGSGEVFFGPGNEMRLENLRLLANSPLDQSVKFVIKDWVDFGTAVELWKNYREILEHFEVFYGRVWGGDLSDSELCEAVMKQQLPWRLNRQEHNYIWPPNERGR